MVFEVNHSDDLSHLLYRSRLGDEAASTKLVELYGPHVRRVIKSRMRKAHLDWRNDSMDLWQTIFANFFRGLKLGQYELNAPTQLLGLLTTMTSNAIIDMQRATLAVCRDVRRLATDDVMSLPLAADDSTPSERVAREELTLEFERRMSPDELYLAKQRLEGRSWIELSRILNEEPETLRRRLDRSIDRVVRELGL